MRDVLDLIGARGVSLIEHGLADIALSRQDAIAALDLAERHGLAVVGGEVVHLDQSEPRYPGDSWHSDRLEGESRADYARRSTFESRAYLTSYLPSLRDAHFVLVLGEI